MVRRVPDARTCQGLQENCVLFTWMVCRKSRKNGAGYEALPLQRLGNEDHPANDFTSSQRPDRLGTCVK